MAYFRCKFNKKEPKEDIIAEWVFNNYSESGDWVDTYGNYTIGALDRNNVSLVTSTYKGGLDHKALFTNNGNSYIKLPNDLKFDFDDGYEIVDYTVEADIIDGGSDPWLVLVQSDNMSSNRRDVRGFRRSTYTSPQDSNIHWTLYGDEYLIFGEPFSSDMFDDSTFILRYQKVDNDNITLKIYKNETLLGFVNMSKSLYLSLPTFSFGYSSNTPWMYIKSIKIKKYTL